MVAEQRSEIIPTSQSAINPLRIDDAATELTASDKGLFLFRNSKSDRRNVVYRRKDGNIGRIDPDQ